MKIFLFFTLFLTYITPAQADYLIYQEIMKEKSRTDRNTYQKQVFDKTRDALLAYEQIESRVDYLLFKLKNSTFGQYSEHILFITPFITGNIGLSANNFNFYYKHHDSKRAGIEYSVQF